MHRPATTVCWLAFFMTPRVAQASAKAHVEPVEFEMMRCVEVKAAIHEHDKTTAVVYHAETAQSSPQSVNGGQNLIGRATVRAIPLKSSNAIAVPVTDSNATAFEG
jgi:hypothetical protein